MQPVGTAADTRAAGTPVKRVVEVEEALFSLRKGLDGEHGIPRASVVWRRIPYPAALVCIFGVFLLTLNDALVVLARSVLYSSDSLYLPSLLDDVVRQTSSVRGWIAPPPSCFFPDLLLLTVQRVFFGKSALLLSNAVVQIGFLLLLLYLLLDESARSNRLLAALACGGFLLTFVSLRWDGLVLGPLFQPGHHAGGILVGFSCLLIYNRARIERRVLAVVPPLVCATVASDLVFVIPFVLPFAAVVALDRRRALSFRSRLLLLVALSVLVGLLVPRVLARLTGIIILPGFLLGRFQEFAGLPWIEGGRLSVAFQEICGRPHWIWWTAFVCALFPTVMTLGNVLSKSRETTRADQVLFFAAGSAALSLFVGIAVYLLFGLLADRYSLPFYLFPFVALACVLVRVPAGALPPAVLGVAVLLGGARLFFARGAELALNLAPSPLALCLDSQRGAYQLKGGYGDYWTAKHASYFRKSGFRVNQLERDLRPRFFVNNYHWYFDAPEGAEHNFIVIDRLDRKLILKRLGEPSGRFYCPGAEVFVYAGPAQPRMRRFQAETLSAVRHWEVAVGKEPYVALPPVRPGRRP